MAKNKLMRKIFPSAIEDLKQAGGAIEWKGQQAEKTKPLFDAALARR
jgi:hypothetical protein